MKINIKDLPNYRDDMTAEEKLALVEAHELPEADHTGYISKATFDKTASELADMKKQLKAKMSEAEQAEAERAAKEAEREELLNKLLKDKTVSESRARFLALGYPDELASEAATALADNDNEKLFATQKKHIEAMERAIKAELLKNTPAPPAGNPDVASITKKQFDAMSYSERLKVFNEQPELFKQFTEV